MLITWGGAYQWRKVCSDGVHRERQRLLYRLRTGTEPVEGCGDQRIGCNEIAAHSLPPELQPRALRSVSGYKLGLRVAGAGVRDYLERLQPYLQHIPESQKDLVQNRLLHRYICSILAPLLLNTLVHTPPATPSASGSANAGRCHNKVRLHRRCRKLTRAILAYVALREVEIRFPQEVCSLICEY